MRVKARQRFLLAQSDSRDQRGSPQRGSTAAQQQHRTKAEARVFLVLRQRRTCPQLSAGVRASLRFSRPPGASHCEGLIFTRPGRHGDTNCRHRLSVCGAHLKMGAQRNREADARPKCDRFLAPVLFAPHFAAAGNDEPDFLNRPVGHGPRSPSGPQLEMRHSASRQAQEHADIETVWSDNGSPGRELHRCKSVHGQPKRMP